MFEILGINFYLTENVLLTIQKEVHVSLYPKKAMAANLNNLLHNSVDNYLQAARQISLLFNF